MAAKRGRLAGVSRSTEQTVPENYAQVVLAGADPSDEVVSHPDLTVTPAQAPEPVQQQAQQVQTTQETESGDDAIGGVEPVVSPSTETGTPAVKQETASPEAQKAEVAKEDEDNIPVGVLKRLEKQAARQKALEDQNAKLLAHIEANRQKEEEKALPSELTDDEISYLPSNMQARAYHEREQIRAQKQGIQQAREAQRQKQAATAWTSKVNEAETEDPGISHLLGSYGNPFHGNQQMHQTILEHVLESDVGPHLAKEIVSNPNVANALYNARSGQEAYRILVNAEARVSARREYAKAANTFKPSAPAQKQETVPTTPRPQGSGSSATPDLSKLKGKDYLAARMAQNAKYKPKRFAR